MESFFKISEQFFTLRHSHLQKWFYWKVLLWSPKEIPLWHRAKETSLTALFLRVSAWEPRQSHDLNAALAESSQHWIVHSKCWQECVTKLKLVFSQSTALSVERTAWPQLAENPSLAARWEFFWLPLREAASLGKHSVIPPYVGQLKVKNSNYVSVTENVCHRSGIY